MKKKRAEGEERKKIENGDGQSSPAPRWSGSWEAELQMIWGL